MEWALMDTGKGKGENGFDPLIPTLPAAPALAFLELFSCPRLAVP
jgi:hypothetical protein